MDKATADLLAVCKTLSILIVFETISPLLECKNGRWSAQKGAELCLQSRSVSPLIEHRFCPSEVLKKVPYFVRALVTVATQGAPRALSRAPIILEFLEQRSTLDNRRFPVPRTPEPAAWSN